MGYCVSFLRNRGRVEALIDERRSQIEESGSIPELDRAKRSLESIKNKEIRAMDLYMDGNFDKDYLSQKLDQIRDSKIFYENQVARLERECIDADAAIGRLSDYLEAAKSIETRLDTMTRDERVELVKLVVDKVTVWGKENIEVVMVLNFGVVEASERGSSPESQASLPQLRE